MKLFSWIRK
jgi:cytochrome c oxidase subunit 1